MSAFKAGQDVERRSMEILRPMIEHWAFNGQYVLAFKGRLSMELQRTVGDVLLNSGDAETVISLECKAEEENTHGNFFLETWSNRSRFTTGWMFTLNADWLLYHFLKEDELYVLPFLKLKCWAFGLEGGDGHIYKFPEKPHRKRAQANDTWGRCVPIEHLSKQFQIKSLRPQ